MSDHNLCFATSKGGRDCLQPSHPDSKLGLCLYHWRQAVDEWCEPQPVVRVECPKCGQMTLTRTVYSTAIWCQNQRCNQMVNDGTRTLDDLLQMREGTQREADRGRVWLVYYLRWANRIKIGTTRDLPKRLQAIYHDECLAVEPGGHSVETSRHHQFAASAVDGQREWFHATPDLIEHVNARRKEHGEPLAAARRFYMEALKAA